jgi:hypothetical protein
MAPQQMPLAANYHSKTMPIFLKDRKRNRQSRKVNRIGFKEGYAYFPDKLRELPSRFKPEWRYCCSLWTTSTLIVEEMIVSIS